jgi:hypothetical protein
MGGQEVPMLARVPLLPVLLVTSFAALIATVLWIVGMPMAGTWSALCAAGVAGVMTLLMAFAFSHGGHGEPGVKPNPTDEH